MTTATLEPADETARELAATAYAESDRIADDAIDWVGVHGWTSAALDVIVECYEQSPEFSTFVDDLIDGEVKL